MGGYLVHHGILGQRWGIRRYQNADGTLTEEGKRHQKQLQNDLESGRVNHEQLARELSESGKDNWNKQLNDSINEINNSDYAKRLKEAQQMYAVLENEAMTVNATMGFGAIPIGRGAGELAIRNREFQEYVNRYMAENEDLFASAALKDLGYDDTKAGREFLRKHGIMNWSV